MQSETRNGLVFAVNGERFELSSVDPSTTVLEFLRSQTRFKSVKLGCGEGWFFVCVFVGLLFYVTPLEFMCEGCWVSSGLHFLGLDN